NCNGPNPIWGGNCRGPRHTLIVNDNTGSDIKFGSHYTDKYDFSLQNYAEYKNLYYEYLPDAPIIKYMEVTQVQEGRDTTVYEWNYDGAEGQMAYDPDETTGEYYKHTYDGLSPKVIYETVARGDGEELKIKIIFDQTMNTSNIAVSFGKTEPYNTIAFTTEGWEPTLHPNDTWKGKVSIPKGKDIDGVDTISVNAFAAGTGAGKQIDSDGVLDKYNPGA
ncbi:MAG: hypothetical protein QME81_14435, partial [bacterium]|nr:hypothetical protein [bacterium]